MDIWTKRAVEAEKTYKSQLGPVSLWLRRTDDELHIAVDRGSERCVVASHGFTEQTNTAPASLDWGRWVTGAGESSVQLTPAMPDRAVVVRTESPVRIPPSREAVFFVSIPIWIKVSAGGSKMCDLWEVPSVVRSNIWFGDTLSGELCYSLVSRARRHVEDADHPLYKAICPVKIRNESAHMLNVDRFCVHVEHLIVYGGVRLLWTNEVTIRFQGEDQISRVDYTNQRPNLEAHVKLLTPPRVPQRDTLLKRSLGTFARLTDF